MCIRDSPYAIYRWRKIGLKEDFTFQPVCANPAIAGRMLELLEIKYSASPRNLGGQVETLTTIPKDTREAFTQALSAWEEGFRGPQRGIMATVYRYSRARARETLLGAALSVLESLRTVILSSAASEGQENIFHKRHIAAGIPSMYGTYREPKFDALGLSFRIETLVSKLLEEIAAEITDQYVSRASLRRIASNLEHFARARAIDGIHSQSLHANLTLLREGAAHPLFTYAQCKNTFQFLAQGAQSLVVKSAITHVDRSLDAQGQGFGGVSQPAQIGGHLRYVGIEDEAESSVDVHVELRLVIGRGARGQDAPAQPGHVVEETTAVCAELVWDVVDQTVR